MLTRTHTLARARVQTHSYAVNVVGAPKVPRQRLNASTYTRPRILGAPFDPLLAAKELRTQLASSTLAARAHHALVVAWLAIWKAGADQARLHADVLLDLRVKGVPLTATWRSEHVADKTKAVLEEAEVAETEVQV